jgi:phosphomannomutase
MSNIFSGFDIRGHIDDSLTPEYAWTIGKAFADWLPEDGRVVVVSDVAANHTIVKAIIEGLRLQGRNVIDGGQGDEQTVVQINTGSKTAGGVLVARDDLENLETIQLFQENALPISSDNGLIEISDLIEAGNFVPAAVKGELTSAI